MKPFPIVFLLPTLSLAFVAPNFQSQPTSLQSHASRRTFVTDAATGLSLLLFTPQSAVAKEEAIPATRENVKKAFDDLRYELNGGDGGVARMQRAIDAGDWEGLIDITKTYDQILRKGRVGRVKSFLSDKEKSITTLSANAITFDLIGINRNARPGQENAAEANRYLDELRTDLQLVIDKERLVAYVD
ncbi:hypothetical protein MHU86_23689 [Fragilaria crotonensis]|nr:hypothetical protein MHU86_23689 [Fragilaria crotonensis]